MTRLRTSGRLPVLGFLASALLALGGGGCGGDPTPLPPASETPDPVVDPTATPTSTPTPAQTGTPTAQPETPSPTVAPSTPKPDKDQDDDGYPSPQDCDDTDPAVHPNAPEQCDGVDNNCDGITDGELPLWYPDADQDGYGQSEGAVQACDPGPGYALEAGDCNEQSAAVHPGAEELCNSIDDDCDELTDEDLALSTYYLDGDTDGFGGEDTVDACGEVEGASLLSGDCNDEDPTVFPGATEICDGQDSDCDSLIDEDGTTTYYVDSDGDGFGDAASPVESCDAGGLAPNGDDCDDSSATTHPEAPEVCDGVDNDCDGQTDNGVLNTYYQDMDGDGYGDPSAPTQGCSAPETFVSNNLDCSDGQADINPKASEQCNGLDDNCNTTVDEGVKTVFYVDEDQDGYGNSSVSQEACAAPSGFTAQGGDCNDQSSTSHPGASEACDLVDNDCDSQIDEGVQTTYYEDGDADGYGLTSTTTQGCSAPEGYAASPGDCLDSDSSVFPQAPETCDGKDNDCDSRVDEDGETNFYLDYDRDGYGDPVVTQVSCNAPSGYVANSDDCNDRDSAIHPGATEACNSKDDDCDAQVDEGVKTAYYYDADRDGYGDPETLTESCSSPGSKYVTAGGDCDDLAASVHPDAAEACNTKDDDCDTQVDEGVQATFYIDSDGDTYGTSAQTTQACSKPAGYSAVSTDCNDSAASTNPGASELCDLADNDCDTQIDEGVKLTFYLDNDGDGFGLAYATVAGCTAPAGYAAKSGDCDDSASTTYPGATEACDSKDNDCDASIDEGVKTTYYYDADKDGYGDVTDSIEACSPPSSRYVTRGTDCNDLNAAINPGATEACNGVDDNCDTRTDDVDADGDGSKPRACGGTDCDDTNPSINTSGTEICDGVDNDCDTVTDESDPTVDFLTDAENCGGCGVVCGENGEGPFCLNGSCGSLPVYQHRFQNVTSIAAASNWTTLTGSSFTVKTKGGPLEIELSIPLVGGSHSACRPIVDNQWAGSYESLPSSYIWHEGLDQTGYSSGTIKRMWHRTRVYNNIPAGTHTVAVQCRTDQGTVTAGRTGATALAITREFLGNNKVSQAIALTGTTMSASGSMVKVPGSDLVVTTTQTNIEVTISLPIGNGGHAGCLEFMDGAPITANPAYANTYWYAGLETTYRGWIMWHHTRTYTGVPTGTHTFSIRCYSDSGPLNLGYGDMASVIIVKQIDESLYPSKQVADAYGNGWEISSGTDSRWYTLPNYSLPVNVTRGTLQIDTNLDFYYVAAGAWISCRPMIDGQWAGSYAGLTFTSNEEEGSKKENFESVGWHGMWNRSRIYRNIPTGTRTVTLQCLSNSSGFYVGHYSVGTMQVREVDLIADN